MPINNDVFRVAQTIRTTNFPCNFVNTFTFRGHFVGEWTVDLAKSIVENFRTQFWDEFYKDYVWGGSYLLKIETTWNPGDDQPDFSYQETYAPDDYPASTTAVSLLIPQAAIVLNQRSLTPGRAGRGRIFYGPIYIDYVNSGGYLEKEPTTLPEVSDFIEVGIRELNLPNQDPWEQVIVAGNARTAVQSNHVTNCDPGPVISFLRSRKIRSNAG